MSYKTYLISNQAEAIISVHVIEMIISNCYHLKLKSRIL